MSQQDILTRAQLKTPKAAAIAGIIFSALILVIFWLLRGAVPADPLENGAWLVTDSRNVEIATNLIPFAGVAFLWFIGVLRDRLGSFEDRFFATVFLGSAILFLAMLFCSAAIMAGLIVISASSLAKSLLNTPTFQFARAVAYIIMNVYALKMAAVFMISTSTIVIRTRIVPRWIALTGFALSFILLVGGSWSIVLLPAWVLLISTYIMMDNLRRPPHDVPS